MLKKSKTRKISIPMLLLIVTLFFYILPTGSANEDDEQSNNSKHDEKNWHAPLPDYGPEFFDEIKKDPRFITTRGSFPEITNNDENVDFFSDPVYKCWSDMTEIDQFFIEFDDIVIGSSYAGTGYIIMELESDSSEKVNETTIDEIYKRIDDYCKQKNVSEVPVLFIWSHIEEDLPIPDFGPGSFEEAKNETGFITTRGTMPVITDANEKVEWKKAAGECIHSFRDELHPYIKSSGGPLLGYGYNYRGYIVVDFNRESPESVNDSMIDTIYSIIEDHCEQKGLSEAPVVFRWGEEVNETLPVDDGPDADESDDANLADNEEEIVGNEKTNQAPGFTSIMVILGILSFLIVKRL